MERTVRIGPVGRLSRAAMNAAPAPRPKSPYALAAVLAATLGIVAIVTYARTMHNAPVWDDADLTTDNPYVQSIGGLARIFTTDIWTASAKAEPSSYYRPLPMASYLVNRMLFGNSSASYHGANVFLHAANACLLALFLRRFAPTLRAVAVVVPALWFTAAPVNVEAVAWISGRFDLLGVGAVLAALIANTGRSKLARAGAAGFIVVALFCKEVFVTGFVLLALHDLLVLRRSPRGEVAKYTYCVAGLVAFFACRKLVGVMSLDAVAGTPPLALAQSYTFLLATFMNALVYPAHLDQVRAYVAPSYTTAAVTLACAAALAAGLLASVRARPDDTRLRLALFGVAWGLLAFAPASLTGPNLEIVGDRYAYYPLVGAFLVVAALTDRAWPRQRAPQATLAVVVAACLGVHIECSRARLLDWKNDRTLYEASLRDNPSNPYPMYALGYLDALEGNFSSADLRLTRSLALRPRSWRTLNALCYVRLHQHEPATAEELCERSLALEASNPRAWINLASTRVNQRHWAAGRDAAEQAVAMKPRSAEARYLRAACLANMGALDAARDDLRVALEVEPTHAGARSLAAQLDTRRAP